jgi:signal transduction histidine kinase
LAAVPLRQQGDIVGTLTLYASEPGFFSERECQLLRQVGDDLSFAFDVLAGASERERLRDQLDRSRKLESLGRLAGGVAHDFNNLLTVILGGLEEALHLLGPGHAAREALQDSLDATRRSTELTRQLLTIARKQQVSPRVLDLNACVEGSLKLLHRLLGEDVPMRWQPGAGLGPVRADATQLDQVLTNLCLNARDALRPGGCITISTANAPGDLVSLIVADDGCGMSAEAQAHLFEPFFTTKPHGKGTGLGLSTVYGIVQQAGGSIAVDSAPGRGSTFTISLPRVEG